MYTARPLLYLLFLGFGFKFVHQLRLIHWAMAAAFCDTSYRFISYIIVKSIGGGAMGANLCHHCWSKIRNFKKPLKISHDQPNLRTPK